MIFNFTRRCIMKNLTDRTSNLSSYQNLWWIPLIFGLILVGLWNGIQAQESDPNQIIDSDLYQALEYRLVGPSRGGRVTAVTGVRGQIQTYYMGSTGGGVWKTTDGGITWHNISDGYFEVGSMGALAVAESDPNVVYAGTGSACIRGNVSTGIGVYKSLDAGVSWKYIGLDDVGQIGRILVHPRNPDLVYVAALGHAFGPNSDRGVYRSKNGGKTWKKVLFLSDSTGAVDLSLENTNPRVIYAVMWRAERKPWTLISGAKEGGIYKSTNNGDTWIELTNGLPDTTGRIGIAVSPVNPQRVWALVEAFRGKAGLYRSDDSGRSWQLINTNEELVDRPWYYNHVYADPQDENRVYIASRDFWRSLDGGESFDRIQTPHGDNHDLWINPDNNQIMIEGNDGGANVSFNGGQSWSEQINQPTAEFYSLEVDKGFPYRLYGPQQDNTSISVPSRLSLPGDPIQHWEIWGCETGEISLDPRDPNIIYTACFGDGLQRFDRMTGQTRQIGPLGTQAHKSRIPPINERFRFSWNAPVLVSQHYPGVIYFGSQYVHRSKNQGQSWEVISPELTCHDSTKLGWAGEPITRDMTGVEVYSTLIEIVESPMDSNVLWVGSNDGLIHVSRDRGRKWKNVTPPQLPEWSKVQTIEASPHGPGRALAAVYRYRMDDFRPFVFQTDNYGESWSLLTNGCNGIPADHPVRVVREDPDRQGLLYAGTEFGLFVSFDDGAHWQSLQLNLPHTPVTDLKVHEQDLVVATQGRSFWILDDVTLLHQLKSDLAHKNAYLFKPRNVFRSASFRNPPNRALIFYYFAEEPDEEVILEILDSQDQPIRMFSSTGNNSERLFAKAGTNRFVWDLHHFGIQDEVVQNPGPIAIPGTYQVRLSLGDWIKTQTFEIFKDPRLETTLAEFETQFDVVNKVKKCLKELNDNVEIIRDVKGQVQNVAQRYRQSESAAKILKYTKTLTEQLTELEAKMIFIPNGPIMGMKPYKLYGDLRFFAGWVNSADARPTDQQMKQFRNLENTLQQRIAELKIIIQEDVVKLNQLLKKQDAAYIVVPAF